MTTHHPSVVMKPEGSIKICVSNGSRQIDRVIDNNWITVGVFDEAGLLPGIYQLSDAKSPAMNRDTATFSRSILHVSDRHVYQFSETGIVKHERSLFAGEPKVGREYDVSYEGGRGATVDVPGQERRRNQSQVASKEAQMGL